jgi:hypothetical protein
VTPQNVDFANGRANSKDPYVSFPDMEIAYDSSFAAFDNFVNDMNMLEGEGAESQQDESSFVTTCLMEDTMKAQSVTDTTVSNDKNESDTLTLIEIEPWSSF